MAAPHVAGAWAVMRQAYPGLSVDLAEFLLKIDRSANSRSRQQHSSSH